MVQLLFATGNVNKVREASLILSRFNIGIRPVDVRKVEIQSDSIEEIVEYALRASCMDWLVVEDDGLFIEALRGFPGPYSSYVYRTIGLEGVLKLMEGASNRSAYFKSVVGLCMGGRIYLFTGVVKGMIAGEIRGSLGFGYDPIFIPEGYDKTFAEMGPVEKSRISHRARAFTSLAEFLAKQGLVGASPGGS